MNVSIVMPVYDRPTDLDTVLESIRLQRPAVSYEIIVVNDGPQEDEMLRVCDNHGVEQFLSTGNTRYRNPACAWNIGYKAAKGQVIISQGADVMHANNNAIQALYDLIGTNTLRYIVGTVFNVRGPHRLITRVYTAPDRPRDYGGLQAIWRMDIYAIGGMEEQFPEAGWDDNYRAACLQGRGIMPKFTTEAVGFHLEHSRGEQTKERLAASETVFRGRLAECKEQGIPPTASGGAWSWVDKA